MTIPYGATTSPSSTPQAPKPQSLIPYNTEQPSPESQPESEKQGWFSYIGNLATHYMTAKFVQGNMDNPLNALMGGYNPDPNSWEGKVKALTEQSRNDPNHPASIVFNDYMHLFGHLLDNTSQSFKDAISGSASAIFSKDALGNLGKGLAAPIQDYMELSTGLDLTGDDIHQLTAEQKSKRIEDAMGFAVSAASGMGAARIGEKLVLGNLAKGILVGASAGASYGLAGKPNDPNQLSAIFGNAIIGGGLGSFGPMVEIIKGSKVATLTDIKPEEVAQIKQIQGDVSPSQIMGMSKAAISATDLADVILQGKVPLSDKPTIIPGISLGRLAYIQSNLPEGFRSAFHVNDAGEASILVQPDSHPNATSAEQLFEKRGVVPGQIVQYLDKDGWEVSKISQRGVMLKHPATGSLVEASMKDITHNNELQINSATDQVISNLYQEWRGKVSEPYENGSQKYQPIGFDETPPNDILDKVPELESLELLKHLDGYLEEKGFSGDQKDILKNRLQMKMAQEAHVQLEPAEREMVNASINKLPQREIIKQYRQLKSFAHKYGLDITDGGSGRIIVKTAGSNTQDIRGFNSIGEAEDFIRKSGSISSGTNLDSNAQLVTGSANGGGGKLPPDITKQFKEDEPFDHWASLSNQAKSDPGEGFFRGLMGQKAAFITRYRDYLSNTDRVNGSSFIAKVYNPVITAINKANGAKEAHVNELQSIFKGLKSNPEYAERIGNYLETMSPDEVVGKFMSRPMTPTEVTLGRQIADSKVKMDQLFRYREMVDRITSNYAEKVQNPENQKAFNMEIASARSAYNITPDHLKIDKLLDTMGTMPKDQLSMGAVLRYARALNPGANLGAELDRASFAKLHNMSPGEIAAAQRIDALYGKLAKIFGINPARQLGGYMNHAKLYYDGNIPRALNQFSGDLKTKEFVSKLSRVGNISAYEDNAFKAMLRYINDGFDVHLGASEAIIDAKNYLKEQLDPSKTQLGGEAKHVGDVASRFLEEVRSIPAASDLASDEAVRAMDNNLFRKLGISLSETNLRSISRSIRNTINFSALGFRPYLGISHLGLNSILTLAARDASYLGRVLKNGAEIIRNDDALSALKQKGVFRSVAPYSSMEADDVTFMGKTGQIIEKAQRAAFKATLLPTAYELQVAGNYITTYEDVLHGLQDFKDGKITAKQLDKKLFISRYDVPITDRFKDLAKTNVEDAAHFLGMQAVEDLVGTYGSGNTPWKWGTIFGKILGQYGNFSRFVWGSVTRIASRGTVGERLGGIAKLTAAHLLLQKASDETGLNLTKMSPFEAMWWMGGPAIQFAKDASTAIHGYGFEQQQAKNRMMRMLPIDPRNGNVHPSIFVPGSYAVDGLIQAADDFSQGNTIQGFGQIAGFRREAGANLNRKGAIP